MDFSYYRCSGTDGYRFGGERICSNTQVRADTLENQIWENVCKILRNPEILEGEDQNSSSQSTSVEANVDTLIAQRQKLQHGIDRLIDSLAEGVIDKDQFTPRMNRTKTRRYNKNFDGKYATILEALAWLPDETVIDGEVVALFSVSSTSMSGNRLKLK